jgi:hypothetical protein
VKDDDPSWEPWVLLTPRESLHDRASRAARAINVAFKSEGATFQQRSFHFSKYTPGVSRRKGGRRGRWGEEDGGGAVKSGY